ncbi:MAG: MFS transporter [Microbacteriaceae bacterium]|nr:MFS transporter [Microbacteriaceae bacterium]MCL2794780.1 MFS transporter [Microbacteriaceae bacterium]
MSTATARIPVPRELARWRNAIFVIFALSGLLLSSFAARLPAVRDALKIDPGQIGLLIICISFGAILGLVVAPPAAQALGSRNGMAAALIVGGVGLLLAGIGATLIANIAVTVVGLAMLGLGNGAVDVMMNVSGAAAERRIGRTLMPFMHACFSLGTVLGALVGAGAAALNVPTWLHLTVMGVLIAVAVAVAVRFVPARVEDASAEASPAPTGTLRQRIGRATVERITVWRDLSLVLIGVVMLGMAFAEGSANDWITLASVDEHGASSAQGALVLDAFLVAMTLGRMAGGPFVDRFGRVTAIRSTAGLAVVGLLMFILGGNPVVFVTGAVLWGLGASLGFPLGMSAAADDEKNATTRVAAVALIGYLAFLAGPPFIGFLADHVGILHALFVVLALCVASLIAAPAVRHRVHGVAAVHPDLGEPNASEAA